MSKPGPKKLISSFDAISNTSVDENNGDEKFSKIKRTLEGIQQINDDFLELKENQQADANSNSDSRINDVLLNAPVFTRSKLRTANNYNAEIKESNNKIDKDQINQFLEERNPKKKKTCTLF